MAANQNSLDHHQSVPGIRQNIEHRMVGQEPARQFISLSLKHFLFVLHSGSVLNFSGGNMHFTFRFHFHKRLIDHIKKFTLTR